MKHALLALALVFSMTSQAQILKKIGEAAKNTAKQGVETLKQNTKEGITNAAELLVGSKHGQDTGKTKSRQTDISVEATAQIKEAATGDDHAADGLRWGDYPTVEVDFDDFEWAKVTDVYDDIFAIQKYDSKGTIWNFYNVETAKAVSTRGWRTQDTPRFDNGICAVCDTAPAKGSPANNPKYQWYILRKTGETTALDPTITAVGNFCDGLAVAKANGKMFFIDDKGKAVLPDVKPNSFITYPLKDARRLFLGGFQKFGYLDAEGRVVIEPQYKSARNFSSNHAIVRNASGKNVIIDPTGREVSEIPSQYMSFTGTTITDFVCGGAVALNTETERYDIITPTMEVRNSFDKATAFYNTLIIDEANALVMNNDWKHPKLCTPNGRTSDSSIFITIQGNNGEEVYLQPEPNGEPDNPLAADLLDRSYWNNTGLRLANVYLVNTTGALFNSSGEVLWKYDNEHIKPEDFSPAGYAKGIVMEAKSAATEEHFVFFDTLGNIKLEVVAKTN